MDISVDCLATETKPPLRVLLCSPRGFCAGVVRAIDTVERALAVYGPPVYVRHEIVHNKYVVESLKAKGAVFVEDMGQIPDADPKVVFSAHGVPKSVLEEASRRAFVSIDATCPLVTKVHREAEMHFRRGREIVLIGHHGHPEVEGTLGQVPPGAVSVVQTIDQLRALGLPRTLPIAYAVQTTYSVDDAAAIIALMRETFDDVQAPATDDICYATTNRQAAVKQLARECDLVLVIGSRNSSNSNRLVEVARECGSESHLIDSESQVREEWLKDKRVVGITSGASAPEELVQRLVEFFRGRGTREVRELEVVHEDVRFMLPKAIRRAMASA